MCVGSKTNLCRHFLQTVNGIQILRFQQTRQKDGGQAAGRAACPSSAVACYAGRATEDGQRRSRCGLEKGAMPSRLTGIANQHNPTPKLGPYSPVKTKNDRIGRRKNVGRKDIFYGTQITRSIMHITLLEGFR